jgi:hypothetical protein
MIPSIGTSGPVPDSDLPDRVLHLALCPTKGAECLEGPTCGRGGKEA